MSSSSKTINLFWWIPVGVLIIVGLVFGTSFDLPIAQAVINKGNVYSLIFALIGSLPAFVLLGFVGPLFAMFFKEQSFKHSKTLAKVVFFVCPVVSGLGYGIDVLKDYMKTPIALVLGVAIVLALTCLLYIPFKNGSPKQSLRDGLVICLTIGLSIILGLLLKKIFVRPRPLAVFEDASIFVPWFKVFGNKVGGTIDPELLDSFPSGHATLASTLFLLPLLAKYNEKTSRFSWAFFIGAGVWLLLTSFARMSGGSHFLSDVSFGSLIGAGLGFIFNSTIKVKATEENG